MCIINSNVKRVFATKLLVLHAGKKQLTIYQNSVQLQDEGKSNAMILPFPKSKEYNDVDSDSSSSKSIVLYKLKINDAKHVNDFDDLFKIAEDTIPKMKSRMKRSITNNEAKSKSFLKVETVGSYSVSLAENIFDLTTRFDPRIFVINPTVLTLIKKRYPTNFGFLICQLQESKTYHPFAYIHDSLSETQAFVPTFHHHGDDGDDGHHRHHHGADWDHVIYLINAKGKKDDDDEDNDDDERKGESKEKHAVEVKLCMKDNPRNAPTEYLSDDFNLKYGHVEGVTIEFALFFKHHIPKFSIPSTSKVRNVIKVTVDGDAPNGDLILEISPQDKRTTNKELVLSSSSSSKITVCDLCERENIQLEYKMYHCTVCDDVDFCQSCVAAGKHRDQSGQKLHRLYSKTGHTIEHMLGMIER